MRATKVVALAKRVAVISDVHGNWHALEAVLEDLEREQPDELWCLGDLVGYGPRPNPCCAAVEQRAAICLAGNHDLGVLGELDLEEFSGDAVVAARWTRSVLAEGSRSFLQSLQPRSARDGVELFHASPRDPVWEYVLSADVARTALELTESPLVLVGHSHVPLAITLEDDVLDGGLAADGTTTPLGPDAGCSTPARSDSRGTATRVRPGCCSTSRRGTASFRRVEYDVASTQEEIRERELPDALAQRLAHGV